MLYKNKYKNKYNNKANPHDRYHWYKEYKMKFVKASLCLSIALAITGCGEKVSLESHLNKCEKLHQ